MVGFLPEGWYRNAAPNLLSHHCYKQPVYCRKLWVMRKDIARTTFVLLCDGILVTAGALVVDNTFEYESVILPVDTLVVDLIRVELDNSKFGLKEIV